MKRRWKLEELLTQTAKTQDSKMCVEKTNKKMVKFIGSAINS